MRVILFLSILLVVPVFASGAVIYVPTDSPTIQGGLDLAEPGDIVEVACGIYFEHDIMMKAGVHLRSETGDPDCVTVDAASQGRVLHCEDLVAPTEIEGLTLTGGEVEDHGGGIKCYGSNLTISSCIITQNQAGGAGGIILRQSDVVITDCTISENTAAGGGGGMTVSDCSPLVDGCRFIANSAMDGGGFWNRMDSSPEIVNCLFVNNEAQFWGGGYASDGWDTEAVVRNCTFYGNTAGWTGGGIWVANDTLRVENSIISFGNEGGGICNDSAAGGRPSMVEVICSNVFHNEEGNYSCDIEDQTGINGNISSHPQFCDQAGGDFNLAPSSPCLPDNNDCGVLIGAFGLGCDSPTATPDDAAPSVPAALSLGQNSPNPFNPSTEIDFRIGEAAQVSLTVFDLTGRRVRTLIAGIDLSAGEHQARWDGTDDQGRTLTSGIYFARIQADELRASIQMVLIK